MARPDRRGLVFHRSQQPCVLDHAGNPGTQCRGPGIAGFERLDGTRQIRRQMCLVDFEMVQNPGKVGI